MRKKLLLLKKMINDILKACQNSSNSNKMSIQRDNNRNFDNILSLENIKNLIRYQFYFSTGLKTELMFNKSITIGHALKQRCQSLGLSLKKANL